MLGSHSRVGRQEDDSAAAQGVGAEVSSLGTGRPGHPRSDASEERQQVARRAVPRARGLEGEADEGDLVKSRGSLEGGRGRRLQRDFQTADTPSDECRRHYTTCFTSPWEQKALAEPAPYLLFLRSLRKNTGKVHLH